MRQAVLAILSCIALPTSVLAGYLEDDELSTSGKIIKYAGDQYPEESVITESSSKIGINVTGTPDQTLSIRFDTDDDPGDGSLLFDSSGGTPLWSWRNHDSNGYLILESSWGSWKSTPALAISRSANNIGMGTATPSYKLDVNGTGRFVSDLTLGAALVLSTNSTAHIKDSGGTTRIQVPDNGTTKLFDAGGTTRLDIVDNGNTVFYDDGYLAALTIDTAANVIVERKMAIGTSSTGGYELMVNGWTYLDGPTTVDDKLIADNLNVGTSSAYHFEVSSAGQAYWNNNAEWYTTSDRRLKTQIRPLVGALDRIAQLEPVEFQYIAALADVPGFGPDDRAGFIAQEVEGVFPGWVQDGPVPPEVQEAIPEAETVKGLAFSKDFDALVVGSIKELRTEDDTLRAAVAGLQEQVSYLTTIVCLEHPEADICLN